MRTEIPDDWESGGYVVELIAHDERGETVQDAFFIVRPRTPAERTKIALIVASYTWQAYNDWGGGSAYTRDCDTDDAPRGVEDQIEGQRSAEGFSPRLSFDRPWARGLIRLPVGAPRLAMRDTPPIGWAPRFEQSEWAFANGYSHWSGMAGWAGFEAHFVRWAESAGYKLDLLSQWDLDRNPDCLAGYSTIVTVGHDEYWTASGRRSVDRFVETGGTYARLAGNIMWQVRIEDEGRTFVCHKYVPEGDPLANSPNRSERTGAFESQIIDDPPVTTFGANGFGGIYSRMSGFSPRGVGGFIVYRNDHWLFSGTDLYYGDVFGSDVPLVAYESDGLRYTFHDGLPVPTGEDGSPERLEILALTPVVLEEEDHGNPGGFMRVRDGDLAFVASAIYGVDSPKARERVRRGSAVITSMKKGNGQVVCAGTTEWPYALAHGDPVVGQITRNILDRY